MLRYEADNEIFRRAYINNQPLPIFTPRISIIILNANGFRKPFHFLFISFLSRQFHIRLSLLLHSIHQRPLCTCAQIYNHPFLVFLDFFLFGVSVHLNIIQHSSLLLLLAIFMLPIRLNCFYFSIRIYFSCLWSADRSITSFPRMRTCLIHFNSLLNGGDSCSRTFFVLFGGTTIRYFLRISILFLLVILRC